MRNLKRAVVFSLGLVCGAAMLAFVARNRDPVVINYYLGSTRPLPVWAVAMWAFFLGAVIPVVLHFAGVFELFLDRRRLSRRVEELEKELVELRNMPLTEARIDFERPRPAVRPLVDEPRVVTAEVVRDGSGDDLREADLYPAVYDKREG